MNSVAGAQHGADLIDGGAGYDTLRGGGGADVVYGGADSDVIYGDDNVSNGADSLQPSFHGNDYLDGGDGVDYLVGGAGNDTYVLGRGYGSDTAQENDSTAVNHDMLRFMGGIATDQIWPAGGTGTADCG